MISSCESRLLRSSGTSVSSSGTLKNRRRQSSETKARTTSRSADSGHATASNTAVVVTPPRGAHTSAHQRPSVASPSSIPWCRHSCASRSTGVAAHADPGTRAVGC